MMELDLMLSFTRQGLMMALWLCLPVVVASALAGIVVAIIQAATQLQDQAASAALRLIVGAVVLVVTAGWIGQSSRDFVNEMWRTAGFQAPETTY